MINGVKILNYADMKLIYLNRFLDWHKHVIVKQEEKYYYFKESKINILNSVQGVCVCVCVIFFLYLNLILFNNDLTQISFALNFIF